MKKWKRIVSVMLVFCIVIGLVIVPNETKKVKAETLKEGDCEYEIIDEGSVLLKKYLGSQRIVDIPAKVGGRSVVRIGQGAFWECISLEQVTIPSGIAGIEANAFWGCKNLKEMIIPDSVLSISSNAFDSCTGLESIRVDGGNLNYFSKDGVLFNKKNGTEMIRCPEGKAGVYTIPEEVVKIGNRAFANCKGLTEVVIQDCLRTITYGAFMNCTGLEEIRLSSSVSGVSSGAFSGCTSLRNIEVDLNNLEYSSYNGDLYSSDKTTFIMCPEGKTKINFLSGITDIGAFAFAGCNGITEISIPDSVNSIGASAFLKCKGLQEVAIPNGVADIKMNTFEGCESLTSIIIPNSVSVIEERAFYGCNVLNKVEYAGVKEQWEKIDIYKSESSENGGNLPLLNAVIYFSDGTTLNGSEKDFEYQILNDNTVEIMGYTGNDPVLIIPSVIDTMKVTSIGKYAFNGCDRIMEINIPSSVVTIKPYAFYRSSAEKIKIPSSVANIGEFAFLDCERLTEISVAIDNAQYMSDNGGLYNADKSQLISCPAGKMGLYAVPSGVENIGPYAFSGCKGLTEIMLPSSVTGIQVEAFEGCEGLRNLTIPTGVKMIGSDAFKECIGLQNIIIPSTVTYIGDGAFRNCQSLTGAAIPFGVTRIGQDAFNGCIRLKEIQIPSSVTELGKDSFYGCADMVSVTLPSSIVKIEDNAFGKCNRLNDIYYSGNEEQWNQIDIYFIDNSNEPLRTATIHLKNGITINGPEKDADYKIGKLSAYDQAAKTVKISGQIYAVAEGFSFSGLAQIAASKEPVIATFSNGKITKIESVKDALQLKISITANSEPPITLQDSGYLNDCQAVLAELEVVSTYPKSVFLGVKDIGMDVREITVSSETEGFCIRHLDMDRDHNTNSIKESVNRKLLFGEKTEYRYEIYIKNGFVFSEEELPYIVKLAVDAEKGTVEEQETMYAYFEHTMQEVNLADAREELDKLKNGDSLLLERDLQNYLSSGQIDVIESYIYCWLAEINYAYQYKKSKNIKTLMMQKVGLDPEADFTSGNERAVTHVTVDTKYGPKSIEIVLNIGKPDSQGNLYPSFGNMYYEILEKNMIPEGLPVEGQIGKASYTDLEQFIQCVAKADEDSLHSTYKWSSLRDEMVAGVLIDKTVISMIGDENGSFADGVYKVYLQPVFAFKKKVTIACPVNVFVYNMDGRLVGSIIDNQVKIKSQVRQNKKQGRTDSENITMQVNGDSKTVYLTGDDYYINLKGTDHGSMDYTVEEIANDEINRKVEFLQMQLEKDLQYRGYVFKPLNIDSQLYALQKMDGTDQVVYSNSDSYESIFKRIMGLSLNQSNTSMNTNKTVQLNASLIPENASNKKLKWTSDNGSVVSVGNDGLVTAVGTGQARITVATQDGSNLKATCMIVVGKGSSGNTSTGSSPSYVPGGGNMLPSQDTSLPSQEPVVEKLYYIVNFHANNGTDLSRKTMTLLSGDALGILPKVKREHYAFLGWYTRQEGGNQVTSDTVLEEATTLYARWEQVEKPGKVTALKIQSPKSGQIKVSYKEVSNAKGYEIVYTTDKKFPSAKTVRTTVAPTVKTFKNLKKEKTYYVKVRAYQMDSAGNKIFGAYSTIKKIKVKK